MEKKDAQLNEVLSASNLDPTALTVVTRKLEVSIDFTYQTQRSSTLLKQNVDGPFQDNVVKFKCLFSFCENL